MGLSKLGLTFYSMVMDERTYASNCFDLPCRLSLMSARFELLVYIHLHLDIIIISECQGDLQIL